MAKFVPFFLVIVLSPRLAIALAPINNRNLTDSSLMYMNDDLQCLAQMPLNDLLKIQKNIASFHTVSEYDKFQMVDLSARQLNDNSESDDDGDSEVSSSSELRELPEAEPRTIFKYFRRTTTTSTEPPLAASLISTPDGYSFVPNSLLQ